MSETTLPLAAIPRVPHLTRTEFLQAYLNPLRPVIMTELASTWPALNKWSLDFFKSRYGDKPVRVYNGSFATPGRTYMSNVKTLALKDYLDLIMTTSEDLRMFLYNLKREMPELISDIEFPTITSGFSKQFLFMFFGCRGSVTQMHFDIDMSHVFHTTFLGKKRIFLFPNEEGKNLYQHPFTCRSYVDVDNPDLVKFPRLGQAKGYHTVLTPGETLFIPAGYWHHVVYDEPGYALSLRCRNHRLRSQLRGMLYLGILSPIDRVMNKVCPERWFQWKKRKAALMT